VINWLETFDNSTASFDRAFAENVMDSFIFDYGENVNWFTLKCDPFLSFVREY